MTAQTLRGAVEAVAAIVASVSGVKASPAFHLFNINERVFALNYVMTSVVEISETGTKQHLSMIVSDILTPFVGAYDEIDTILGIADAASTALISEMSSAGTGTGFNGAIDTYENCRVDFLPYYLYNDVQHIGYRVMLENAKLKLDL